jgi:hypothetical protein
VRVHTCSESECVLESSLMPRAFFLSGNIASLHPKTSHTPAICIHDDVVFLIIPQHTRPNLLLTGPTLLLIHVESMSNPSARKRAAHDGLRRVHPNDD